jgi:hypothetical protein
MLAASPRHAHRAGLAQRGNRAKARDEGWGDEAIPPNPQRDFGCYTADAARLTRRPAALAPGFGGRPRPPSFFTCLPALALALAALAARAEPLGQWNGFDISWDTTIRVSLGLRTEPADDSLLARINADDGDRAFTQGPDSERIDVITELTGQRGALGFDLSAQGWYDAAYNTDSANTSPATFNPITSSNRGFPADVRDLMGRDVELLNANLRDTIEVADLPVTVSIGRQTLLWGESLLFPENGIAAAQAPVDDIKAAGEPLAQARELFLPVAQIVVRLGLGGGLSLEAYDQFEWRRDRLPAVGSYFSTTDILDAGGQRILAADGVPTLYREGDETPHGIGQFGAALRQSGGDIDWGLYALRADARLPTLVTIPDYRSYRLDFARDSQLYGASVSTYLGDANIAGEISLQHDVPLDAIDAGGVAGGGGVTPYLAGLLHSVRTGPAALVPPISRGTTVNAQASINTQLPPGRFADGATLQAEIAGNTLTQGVLPAGRTRFAAAFRAVLTPQYFHVLPGLDLACPMGVGIGLTGFSAVDSSQNAGAGFVSLGVTATYHVVWQGALNFTHYVGGAGAQPLADRDFAVLSVTRSF